MSKYSDARRENFFAFLKGLGLGALFIIVFFVIITVWSKELDAIFPDSLGYAFPIICFIMVCVALGLTCYGAYDGCGRGMLVLFFLFPTLTAAFAVAAYTMEFDPRSFVLMGAYFPLWFYLYVRLGVGECDYLYTFNAVIPALMYVALLIVLSLIGMAVPVLSMVLSIILAVASIVGVIVVFKVKDSVVDNYR